MDHLSLAMTHHRSVSHSHSPEMLMVDVGIDAKQPLEDGLGDLKEVLGEGDADLRREQSLVVQLVLEKCHC